MHAWLWEDKARKSTKECMRSDPRMASSVSLRSPRATTCGHAHLLVMIMSWEDPGIVTGQAELRCRAVKGEKEIEVATGARQSALRTASL
eukprot:scaffold134061_cov35-Tisochrysis_lutea.AAC.4